MHISASLLAADAARLGSEVRRSTAAGVDSFHFDVMDGHYVPNIALSPSLLAALRPHTILPFHVHLELSNPDEVLERFQPFHAGMIIVCRDTLSDPLRTFTSIRSRSAQAGLSLGPDDTLEQSRPLLFAIDLLLILAVHPGFGGQAMQPGTVARVADARRTLDRMGLHMPLAVDGGVTFENAPALIRAGADTLVIGSALFQAPRMNELVSELRGSPLGSRFR